MEVLLGALSAIIASIITLLFTRVNKKEELKAIESGQQTEQIRLHALECGETLLESIDELKTSILGIKFAVDYYGESITTEQYIKEFTERNISDQTQKVRRSIAKNSVYLSTSIIDKGLNVYQMLINPIESDKLHEMAGKIDDLQKSLRSEFQKEYLGNVL